MLRRAVFIVALVAVGALPARSQTISPVIVEYQQKANGRFEVKNDSDIPLAVVLEPESFRVDSAGKPTFYPLDQSIHLELSTTSFRIAAHQTYLVFYKASADHLPAWFTIYATITGARTTQGLELAIHLPHTVYLLTKKPLVSASVVWDKAEFSPANKEIEGSVSNSGAAYARVVDISVTDAAGKEKQYTGFPFFPGQKREFQLPWDEPAAPKRIKLKFQHFTSDSPIQIAAATK